MLKLRLKRFGRKKLACYRIVIMESTSRRDGKPIKEVGLYNPITDHIKLNTEEILVALKNGVKPTKTVFNLLVKSNILEGKA
jgi:small subunit ribosomal protein S16|uniref:ribosomal protein S16 n=1 Tax=Chattonella marina TaxID=90936 RepID=UPI002115B07D|nr:ribosomal protein S16 [Chattonella marina]UTE94903.1 ribosomal protein S16 [Chattonella marina]